MIVDPARGTAGFLVAAGEHLRDHNPEVLRDDALRRHFYEGMFHGFDFAILVGCSMGAAMTIVTAAERPGILWARSGSNRRCARQVAETHI